MRIETKGEPDSSKERVPQKSERRPERIDSYQMMDRHVRRHSCRHHGASSFVIFLVMCCFGASYGMQFVCEPSSVVAGPGEEITLCCTVNKPAKFCTWYWSLAYSDQEPRTLKKFAPINSAQYGPGTDCSLVVRTPLTEDNPKGLFCEVLSEDRQEGVESRVAVITVSRNKGAPPQLTAEPQNTEADHGQPVVLECAANFPARKCEWFTPYGAVFVPQPEDKFYSLVGDFKRGNCSLKIAMAHARDEGDWRCKMFLLVAPSEEYDASGGTLSGGTRHPQPTELESKSASLRIRDSVKASGVFPETPPDFLFGLPKGAIIGIGIAGLLVIVVIIIFAIPGSRHSVLSRVSKRQRNKIDIERNLLAPVTIEAINARMQSEQRLNNAQNGSQRTTASGKGQNGSKGSESAYSQPWNSLPRFDGQRVKGGPEKAPEVAPRPEHSLRTASDDTIYIQPANVYENLRPGVRPPSPPPSGNNKGRIYANLKAQFRAKRASFLGTSPPETRTPTKPPVKPKPVTVKNTNVDIGHVNDGADLSDSPSVSNPVLAKTVGKNASTSSSSSTATAATSSTTANSSRSNSTNEAGRRKPVGSAIYEAVKKFEGR